MITFGFKTCIVKYTTVQTQVSKSISFKLYFHGRTFTVHFVFVLLCFLLLFTLAQLKVEKFEPC